MNEERIREVFSDELFVKQLLEQEEPEQVQALLAEKDIDITVENIENVKTRIEQYINGELDLDQLSDEDLEDVSGGCGCISIGLIVGIIGAVVAGTAAVGGGIAGGAVLTNKLTRRRW